MAAGLGLVVLVALGFGGRALRVTALRRRQRPVARRLAGPDDRGLLVLLGVAIVASVQGLGNLLVLALLVAPAAAALRASDRLVVQLRLAALFGAIAGRRRDGAVLRGRRGGGPLRGAGGVRAGGAGVVAAGRAATRPGRGPIEGLAGGH